MSYKGLLQLHPLDKNQSNTQGKITTNVFSGRGVNVLLNRVFVVPAGFLKPEDAP